MGPVIHWSAPPPTTAPRTRGGCRGTCITKLSSEQDRDESGGGDGGSHTGPCPGHPGFCALRRPVRGGRPRDRPAPGPCGACVAQGAGASVAPQVLEQLAQRDPHHLRGGACAVETVSEPLPSRDSGFRGGRGAPRGGEGLALPRVSARPRLGSRSVAGPTCRVSPGLCPQLSGEEEPTEPRGALGDGLVSGCQGGGPER